MTVVNLRATHGGGKSTVVRKILYRYPHEALRHDGAKRPYSYLVQLPNGRELAVLGPYETACGGCDAIQPFKDILEYLNGALANDCDVLFEGALVSTTYGSVGELLQGYARGGESVYFAYLDTPIEKCLERVRLRRAARGVTAPLDPKNTVSKVHAIEATRARVIAEAANGPLGSRNIAVATIDHTRAVQQVLALLGVKLKKEPK